MPAQAITHARRPQAGFFRTPPFKLALKGDPRVTVGTTIRYTEPWREDEQPTAANFPVGVVTRVNTTPAGLTTYTVRGRDRAIYADRVTGIVEAAEIAA